MRPSHEGPLRQPEGGGFLDCSNKYFEDPVVYLHIRSLLVQGHRQGHGPCHDHGSRLRQVQAIGDIREMN